ncbi:MAG: tRNA 2-thiouridine(34) synthase MnmA [Candidatus Omnitrophica bacterium]|nr:tRNA 2-thiouridine(34) synthase MnmA [Candidatus Omnitrophota bacterium]
MKRRVVVAMSGGVDSSVAAALLLKAGFEVVGMTMCFNLADAARKKPSCCGAQGIEDASRTAHKLGIKHYVINMQRPLQEYIIKDFVNEYLSGRTPNPCVRCNQFLKFDILLSKAISLDARYLATGHYARLEKSKSKKSEDSPAYLLKKAKDKNKDQSYFLYRLNQYQMRHTLFPLGEYTKSEVRAVARRLGLTVADKVASQEICFLPEQDYRHFLKNQIKKAIQPGHILNNKGVIIGEHKGIPFYTIGQRQGLGIALGHPVYVSRMEAQANRIFVGSRKELLKREFLVEDAHFIRQPIKKKVALRVRIRYNHKEAPAVIEVLSDAIKVVFKTPQFAIAPGQSAVFYERDYVVGGGIIKEVLG